jgi:hypothetical protein
MEISSWQAVEEPAVRDQGQSVGTGDDAVMRGQHLRLRSYEKADQRRHGEERRGDPCR